MIKPGEFQIKITTKYKKDTMTLKEVPITNEIVKKEKMNNWGENIYKST